MPIEQPGKVGRDSIAPRAVRVIIVSSVMLTFISYWRTAAVVLCDLASTSYYIGGIVERRTGHRQSSSLVHPCGHALQLSEERGPG